MSVCTSARGCGRGWALFRRRRLFLLGFDLIGPSAAKKTFMESKNIETRAVLLVTRGGGWAGNVLCYGICVVGLQLYGTTSRRPVLGATD